MSLLAETMQVWAGSFVTFILCALGCSIFEVLASDEKQSWSSRARSIVFWSILLAAAAVIVTPIQALVSHFGIKPLLSIDLRSAIQSQHWVAVVAAYILLPFAPYFLFDCFYYWFHRMQHTVPLLWRFHSVHHAIEELNGANCHHHATEALFRLPFVILPLMLVIHLEVPDVFIMTAVLAAWGQFVHANARISFGVFDRVLASPRFHRVHHSLAPEHWDRNFASFFPIFDILFGTAYFARKEESIKTGLPDKHEAGTVGEYLFGLAPRQLPDEKPSAR